eukprot:365157-Chlamydomonas_euryale.AAC.2
MACVEHCYWQQRVLPLLCRLACARPAERKALSTTTAAGAQSLAPRLFEMGENRVVAANRVMEANMLMGANWGAGCD